MKEKIGAPSTRRLSHLESFFFSNISFLRFSISCGGRRTSFFPVLKLILADKLRDFFLLCPRRSFNNNGSKFTSHCTPNGGIFFLFQSKKKHKILKSRSLITNLRLSAQDYARFLKSNEPSP